jgi:tetratricopeptide (TPR) repeat protein
MKVIFILTLIIVCNISCAQETMQLTESDWTKIEKTDPNGSKIRTLFLAESVMGWDINQISKEKCEKALLIFNSVNDENAYTYYQKAFCEYVLEKYEDAIYNFTLCINATKDKYFSRDVYIKEGDTCRLLEYIPMNINKDDAYYHRALCKAQLNDYRGAILDYNKVEQTYIKTSSFFINRAISKYYLENYLEAKIDATKSLDLEKNAVAYFMRGLCNNFIGQKEAGCVDLSKAGEMGHSQAYEAIQKYCN